MMRNNDVLIVVGARLNSSRMPGKHLLELAGEPMIKRVVDRLKRVNGELVVATTNDEFNRPLVSWCENNGVNSFAFSGDVNDLIGRVDAVCGHYGTDCKILVYICGDCPLVDPDFIGRCIQRLRKHDDFHTLHIVEDESGRQVSHEGIHLFSLAGWKKLVAISTTNQEREHIGLADKNKKVLLSKGFLEEDYSYLINHRISVDTAADWRFMDGLYRLWFSENIDIVDYRWAINEIKSNISLAKINSHVLQRSGLQKYGHIVIVTEAGEEKGLGQLVRCIRLAERLCEETGLGVRLCILGNTIDLKLLRTVSYEWFVKEDELFKNLKTFQSNCFIFDVFQHRLEDRDTFLTLLKKFREDGKKLFGLDRMCELSEYLDLSIVPNIYFTQTGKPNVIHGKKYITSADWCQERLLAKQGKSRQLTVLTGGSDAFSYGEWLPAELHKVLPYTIDITWVVGPYSTEPKIPQDQKRDWKILHNPESIAKISVESEVVLTVYGTMIFDLVANNIATAVLDSPGLISKEEWKYFDDLKIATMIRNPRGDGLVPLKILLKNRQIRENQLKRAKELELISGVSHCVQRIVDCLEDDAEKYLE